MEVVSQKRENLLKEMADAAVLYGYKISKTHPKLKSFITGIKGTIGIINLEFTLAQLEKAVDFLKEKIKNKEKILLIGTTPAAQEAIKNFSQEFNYPCVLKKWPAGTLTNFKVIRARIDYYIRAKQARESGDWSKYTKKERIKIEREFSKLEEKFGTLVCLNELPNAILMVNPKENETAVREARKLSIPIVGIMGTNFDPDKIDYPIVCNDRAKKSIDWIMNYVKKQLAISN